jgi:hypothetical protein
MQLNHKNAALKGKGRQRLACPASVQYMLFGREKEGKAGRAAYLSCRGMPQQTKNT